MPKIDIEMPKIDIEMPKSSVKSMKKMFETKLQQADPPQKQPIIRKINSTFMNGVQMPYAKAMVPQFEPKVQIGLPKLAPPPANLTRTSRNHGPNLTRIIPRVGKTSLEKYQDERIIFNNNGNFLSYV